MTEGSSGQMNFGFLKSHEVIKNKILTRGIEDEEFVTHR